MRNVVLYIAMSLDGYIADKNGKVDWLTQQEPNPQSEKSYLDFIKTVDTVILGYKTYYQIVSELSPNEWVYKGLESFVVTHKKIANKKDIVFTDESLLPLMKRLKQQKGKDIWVCGGASIVNQLIALNCIDKYMITIMPTILGSGIPLFSNSLLPINLELVNSTQTGSFIELVYKNK